MYVWAHACVFAQCCIWLYFTYPNFSLIRTKCLWHLTNGVRITEDSLYLKTTLDFELHIVQLSIATVCATCLYVITALSLYTDCSKWLCGFHCLSTCRWECVICTIHLHVDHQYYVYMYMTRVYSTCMHVYVCISCTAVLLVFVLERNYTSVLRYVFVDLQ